MEKQKSMSIESKNLHINTAVQYDQRSYMINGEQVFISSAAIHYFRMPKEEWREVLVKAKLAGMNCIDTYFAWNVHEPEEGQWNFEGDNDCGAFLDLCAELGLWVIARPGPFICAEWDFGGFPWWMNTKEDVKLRSFNEPYLKYVDRYFDQIVPIIRKREIEHGGSVILVQVENEYGYLTDDETARDYMLYLRDGLLRRGVKVPLITCVGGAEGTIEGANFWSNADQHYDNLHKKQPGAPKIVTEFWTGWFEHWGASAATQKTAALYEKRLLEVLRAGYSGISHYMFYGGTNFGGYGGRTVGASDIFMVTSYDYDAPLNEYGRVTEKYNVSKRLSYFIQAVEGLLLNTVEGDHAYGRLNEGFTARVREWGDQRIWFVESEKQERESTAITLGSGRTIPVTVNSGAIVPVIDRMEIAPNVRLTCSTYLLCNELLDGVHTLIIAADNGQRSYVELETADIIRVVDNGVRLQQLSDDGKVLKLDSCHFQEAEVIKLSIGEQSYQIVIVNKDMADQSWRIEDKNGVRWALGYPDLDILANGSLKAALSQNRASVLHLGDWHAEDAVSGGLSPYVHLEAPRLEGWKTSVCELSAANGQASDNPKDFSEFGLPFGHLLYECEFESGDQTETLLVIPALQDTARVYLNGSEQKLIRQVGAASVNLKLEPHRSNRLQLLVQHMGRLNFSPFLGEFKGVSGPVYLDGTAIDLRGDWQNGDTNVHLGEVCKAESGVILRRTFTLNGHDRATLVGAMSGKLKINGIDVEINGYQDWFSFHVLDVSEYIRVGENEIEMAYVKSPIDRLELLSYQSENVLNEWRIADISKLERKACADKKSCGTGLPAWHTVNFAKPEFQDDVHAKLKLRLTGMSKGTIWLNGIDLGRYWQIGPQEDYKIPMAWLKEQNELILFDEIGRSPLNVRLVYDQPSNNRWVLY